VNEQKILRQITLPEKYVHYTLFKDTIERIEKTMEKAAETMQATADTIYKRINDIGYQFHK